MTIIAWHSVKTGEQCVSMDMRSAMEVETAVRAMVTANPTPTLTQFLDALRHARKEYEHASALKGSNT